VSGLITSRHDPLWHPGLGSAPVFAPEPNYRGFSRHTAAWRPGMGELSTAEVVARKLGIPRPYVDTRRRSLGQTSTQQISAIAATGASATTGILVALGVVGGPVGAAVGGLISVAQLLVGIFKGCGQTCVAATQIANQVATVLTQNVTEYVGSPIRTQSMQAAALNNFQTAWNALVANCQNPALGTAGQNCISQRQQGACAYKTSPGGWQQNSDGTCTYTWPGANGSGTACWNWFIGFHDPIANDPCVQPDSVATAAATSTSTAAPAGTSETAATVVSVASPNYTPLVLIGAAAVLLWAMS